MGHIYERTYGDSTANTRRGAVTTNSRTERAGGGWRGSASRDCHLRGRKEGGKEGRRIGGRATRLEYDLRSLGLNHASKSAGERREREREKMTMIMMPAAKGVQRISETAFLGCSVADVIMDSSLHRITVRFISTPGHSVVELAFPRPKPLLDNPLSLFLARRPSRRIFFSGPTKEIGVTDCTQHR